MATFDRSLQGSRTGGSRRSSYPSYRPQGELNPQDESTNRMARDPGDDYIPPPPLSPGSDSPSPPAYAPRTAPQNTAAPYFGSDPAKMSEALYRQGMGVGDVSANMFQGDWNQYGQWEEQARVEALAQIRAILENPGYTAEEKAAILDEQGLSGLVPDDSTLASWGLSEDEVAGIRGDPWRIAGYFDPEYLENLQRSGEEQVKGAYGQGRDTVRNTLAGGESSTWDRFGAGRDSTLSSLERGAEDIRGAFGDYGERARGVVTGARGDVLSPFEDPNLIMSDEEVQGTISGAGRKVGASYDAAKEDLIRRAEASGNVNPLSLAAARERMERGSSADRANAMTDAELMAKGLQRGQRLDVATARSGAGKYLSGLGADVESALGSTGVDIEQGISEGRGRAEQAFGVLGTSTASALGQRRLGAEQDLMAGDVDLADSLSRQRMDVSQWNQKTGTDVMRDVEAAEQKRAADLAANRQDIEAAKAKAKYDYATGVSKLRSERALEAAKARQKGTEFGVDAMATQQERAGTQKTDAGRSYLSGQQTSLGAMSDANRTAADIWRAKNASSFKNTVAYPLLRQLGEQAISYGGSRITNRSKSGGEGKGN